MRDHERLEPHKELLTYTLEAVGKANRDVFLTYCREHRYAHDESDLYEESLEAYDPEKWPAVMAIDLGGQVLGVFCYRKMPFSETEDKGRIVLWHVLESLGEPGYEVYTQLFQSMKNRLQDLNHVFGYFPEDKMGLRTHVETLDFDLDRYAWVMVRDDLPIEPLVLPEGMTMKPYREGLDAKAWCQVRNPAFLAVRGSETPMTEERAEELYRDVNTVKPLMQVLYLNERPIGVIRVEEELEEGERYAFIAPIAIHPDFHGQGLGRYMLRQTLQEARAYGLNKAMLSVNALNEKATALYRNEGFYKVHAVACYQYRLKR